MTILPDALETLSPLPKLRSSVTPNALRNGNPPKKLPLVEASQKPKKGRLEPAAIDVPKFKDAVLTILRLFPTVAGVLKLLEVYEARLTVVA